MLGRESTTRAYTSPRLDFSHMADVERAFARLTWTMHVSNLVGALLTWFYFRFVDFTAPQFGHGARYSAPTQALQNFAPGALGFSQNGQMRDEMWARLVGSLYLLARSAASIWDHMSEK